MKITYFDPLEPTSKFPICGMPIRLDAYKTCSFGCEYCFSNGRKIGGGEITSFQVGNHTSVKNRLKKIFDDKLIESFIFLDYLIANNYTWHCGGMSDPFQPAEQEYQATKNIVDVANDYNRHILFSTKSNTTYNVNLNPNLHSFQLSVTNIENNTTLEPNVPNIEERYKFFCELKEKGFLVGIRIQPFIPGISDLKIFEKFQDADHFTIEGLKMVSNNLEQREKILSITGLNAKDFKNYGLLNLRPEIRVKLYEPIIKWLEENKKSYSIADNDLHYLGNNTCCCGDSLSFHKATNFNTTYMSHVPTVRTTYLLDEVLQKLRQQNLLECNCKNVFFSSSQGNCVTVEDFYKTKFDMKSSTFSPQYFYTAPEALNLISKNLLYSDSIKEIEENITIEEKPETITKIIEEPKIIPTNKELINTLNFYGWICPQCKQIYSPALPFCFNCNSLINYNFNNFIPYWKN